MVSAMWLISIDRSVVCIASTCFHALFNTTPKPRSNLSHSVAKSNTGPPPMALARRWCTLKSTRFLRHRFSFPSSIRYRNACSSVSHNVLSSFPSANFDSTSDTVAIRPNTSAMPNHSSEKRGTLPNFRMWTRKSSANFRDNSSKLGSASPFAVEYRSALAIAVGRLTSFVWPCRTVAMMYTYIYSKTVSRENPHAPSPF